MKFELCKNCENFYQHYGVSELMGIHSVFCGHCLEKCDKKITKDNTCPNYKLNKNLPIKKITALNLLYKIEKSLQDTISILKNIK